MSIQHKELSGDELHQPMPVGDDADKTASPVVGDWYLSTDTEKLYVCFSDGSWEEFGVDTTLIKDTDADTKVEVEKTADEDKVRVTTGGTQRVLIDSDGLTLQSGASVNEFSTDTTMAGNSDDAVPTEKAVKAYVDGNIKTVSLGAWSSSYSNNTVYQASTDGFALAITTAGGYAVMRGYTDGSNPPSTLRARNSSGYDYSSICMPVRKNDYWKVQGDNTNTVYWIPINT